MGHDRKRARRHIEELLEKREQSCSIRTCHDYGEAYRGNLVRNDCTVPRRQRTSKRPAEKPSLLPKKHALTNPKLTGSVLTAVAKRSAHQVLAGGKKLSILILNWNGKRFLDACLSSLMQQTFKDFSIIIVDNGSQDGSVEFVSENFPGVNIISLQENLGFCKGNNIGISHAKGEYIALLNNDTEVDRHWLEELAKVLDEHPGVGFCASKMVLYDRRDLIDTAGDYFSIAGSGGKIGHLDSANKERYSRQREVFGACAGAAIYRRSMLEDIGLFDEDFFIAQEDVDLSFRAQLKGYKCLYVPTAVVYHRLNATLKTYSPEYIYYGHRNLEYVYIKNTPLLLLVITFPLHLIDGFLSFCFFVSKGRGLPFVKAKWDVLRALPRLLRKRQAIQSSRTASTIHIAALLEKNWLLLKIKNLAASCGILKNRS